MMNIKNDNPIQTKSEDILNRTNSAINLAKNILSIDYKNGLVIGVQGEWGIGKTSYLNLMKEELTDKADIIEFNPWMFTGIDNLISIFFSELASQLRLIDKKDIADNLNRFGEFFSEFKDIPMAGSFIGAAGSILKFTSGYLNKKEGGLLGLRNEIFNQLSQLSEPIVVIIDDVDRLTSSEIQEIFKLVRLTANFPNIIYLLAFDRLRVAHALSEQNQIDGMAYLEKILQLSFDIPKISENLLQQYLFSQLDLVLKSIPHQFDETRWGNIFYEIIKPFLKNIRDVKRYIMAVSQTLKEIENKIESVDILALEAIRIFNPDKFHEIYEIKSLLLDDSLSYESDDSKIQRISEFIKNNSIYESLIENIFPMSRKYMNSPVYYDSSYKGIFLKNKQIASPIFFNFYFEKFQNSEFLEYLEANKIFLSMKNREELQLLFKEIHLPQWSGIINNLFNFEDEFTVEHAIASIPVLFKLIPLLSDDKKSIYDLGDKFKATTLIYRLIRKTPEDRRFNLIEKIIPDINLSSLHEILEIIGYREGRGHKLLPLSDVKNLENKLIDNFKNTDEVDLADEWNLLWLFVKMKEISPNIQLPLKSTEILLSLLRNSKSTVYRQSVGSYYTQTIDTLFWDSLESLYDSKETFENMIDNLSRDDRFRDDEIISLAVKYRNGWRYNHDVE
ncbi:P-loop NTPase fold protein [Neisseria sp.]|uniref:KAP family P-loop NTPase fold protein n=1 Tax=Neisseria sp. TaxID=192066 RepID=UPI0035A1A3C0